MLHDSGSTTLGRPPCSDRNLSRQQPETPRTYPTSKCGEQPLATVVFGLPLLQKSPLCLLAVLRGMEE